uniref:Protein kinase domain-containing protein n=1 Tax=Steinernema glaseri TaxID=37863 RepID=A0A1I7YY77_9BILA
MSFDRSSEESEEHDDIVLKHYLKPVCVIGRGTFGRVELCRHAQTERHYALKVLNIAKLVSTRQVEHVHNEKRVLAQLQHPFIVKLLSTAKDQINVYMILEFVSGGEIFSYLRASGAFPSPMAKFYAAEVVLALEYIHSFNIAYRDLKPENLMLTADGHIKLTDFGFAKVIHSRSWTICGTAEYLAPEVMSGIGHNRCVDWWALGILIFELMTGKTPFVGANADDIHENIYDNPNVVFPRKTFSTNAKDIVSQLLKIEVCERLGCRKAGDAEVRMHPWFSTINFDDLQDLKIKPPLIPTIHHDGDIGNFDSYDETDADAEDNLKAPQRDVDLFEEW